MGKSSEAMKTSAPSAPKIGLIMGSLSDWEVMQGAAERLEHFSMPYERRVVSAHRTPQDMFAYARGAAARGLSVLIAGAGGAAHLPGMVAALTTLPVIGVPIRARQSLEGWDSLLSIVQMPEGVPVATVGVDSAANAGILAIQILAIQNPGLTEKLNAYKKTLSEKVAAYNEAFKKKGVPKK